MTNQHRATTEQWDDVQTWSEDDSSNSSCILELRARVEALEAANQSWNKKVSKLAGVAKNVSANLKAQHQPATVKDSLTAQPGGLVERVAVIRAIAADARARDLYEPNHLLSWKGVAYWLEQEAQQRPAAVKESLTTQPGGLVEMVADGIAAADDEGLTNMTWSLHSRAAIRAVAAWMRQAGMLNAAELLEQEAGND